MKAENQAQKIGEWLIYTTIFLIPFYFLRFSVSVLRTNLFEVLVLLSFLLVVCRLYLSKTQPYFGRAWPYLFLAIALIGVFVAGDHDRALGIFKGWFAAPVVLYWSILNAAPSRQVGKSAPHSLAAFSRYLPCLIVSAVLISFWAILQQLNAVGLLFYQKADPATFQPYLDQSRVFGPFESPNYLAMFVTPVVFLSLFLFNNLKNKYQKIFLALGIVLQMVAIILSSSQGGLVALSLGLLLAIVAASYKQTLNAKWVVIGLISIILVANSAYLMNHKMANDNLRSEIYDYSIAMVKDDWLAGIGLGGFHDEIAIRSADNASFQADGLQYALHPHNLVLALWLNLGLAGLIVFLLIIADYLKRSIMNGNGALPIIAMLVVLIHGLFDTTYFKNDLSAIFWLMLALNVSNSITNEKKSI